MSSAQSREPLLDPPAARGAAPDRSLYFITILIRQRRLLLWYPLGITVLVVLIAFLFPNQYRSTVVVLPPESGFQSAEFTMTDLGMLAGGGMALPMMATPSDILQAVITSRTVRDSVVSRLQLKTRWNTKEASQRLRENFGATVEQSGIINVWAIDTDRQFADTLVNEMVSEADRLNREIVNTKARRSREFVEGRLAETQVQLDSAARALERFQKEHKTIALDEQIAALVRNAAELKAQVTADEIELSVLKSSLSPEHPSVRRLESRIRESQKRLDVLQTSPSGDTSVALFDNGLKGAPRLVLELAEITRNLKIAENLFTLLTERYETARIQEQRDTPSFSVLDRAAGGGTKVRPMRALIGLATLIVSFGLAVAVILARAYLQELPVHDPARHRALQELRASFRGSRRRDQDSVNPS